MLSRGSRRPRGRGLGLQPPDGASSDTRIGCPAPVFAIPEGYAYFLELVIPWLLNSPRGRLLRPSFCPLQASVVNHVVQVLAHRHDQTAYQDGEDDVHKGVCKGGCGGHPLNTTPAAFGSCRTAERLALEPRPGQCSPISIPSDRASTGCRGHWRHPVRPYSVRYRTGCVSVCLSLRHVSRRRAGGSRRLGECENALPTRPRLAKTEAKSRLKPYETRKVTICSPVRFWLSRTRMMRVCSPAGTATDEAPETPSGVTLTNGRMRSVMSLRSGPYL